ncbi:hypothetical protein A3L11_07175 [Thermococcus siculi]|uniref:Uncharacterized protein n=1 Tax=Thermococcus siculi TaxID=72803 RepID=A0A2Z2MYF1_9EURY|nr:hypothetical protein [Thermococcus siculi]ASJ09020.1 hypothetical protein A3L11_07175 [Thermococcus siculi]
MKGKLLLVAGVALTLLLTISLVIASQKSVMAGYSGERMHSSAPVIYSSDSVELASPPRYTTVYVIVQAEEPLKSMLESRLVARIERMGLKPVVINVEDSPEIQLKGNVLFVYVTYLRERNELLMKTLEAGAMAYYSTSGDIVDFLNALQKYRNRVPSSDVETLMDRVSEETEMRIDSNLIAGDVLFQYWQDIRAKSGALSNSDPYLLLADYLADEIARGISSVEASR